MMKNRYGDDYDFELVGENTYKIIGNLKYWRFGSRGDTMDLSDLGFVDPSGGPFIEPGYNVKGQRVSRIYSNDYGIFLEVFPT